MAINYYAYKARLVRVIDGDTIDVEIDLGFKMFVHKRVRFLGIDTPETRGKQSDPVGFKATEFVREMFAKYGERFILLSKGDDEDLYARIIGTVYWEIDGKYLNLSESLKASGYEKKLANYVEGSEPVLIFEDSI